MPSRLHSRLSAIRRATILLAAVIMATSWVSLAQAQYYSDRSSAVGGVSINAEGVLTNATVDELGAFRQLRMELKAAPEGLQGKTAMRKVSLRRLDEAIRQCVESGKTLPEEITFLAGLQKIEYVFVYPEQNDIVLAGPAEGWKISAKGTVVGATTGRPVMLLDDLVVALRAARSPNPSTLNCSIDPTPEGLQRLGEHARSLRSIGNPQTTAMGIEEKLGPQKITVGGLPDTSHFARVMVAADYRMKRVSMGLERAPVANLPSFIDMTKASGQGMRNMLPRWWLAPNYDPMLRDEEGLSWQLRGGSVKTMAETDFIAANGAKEQTGRADAVSQRWADVFTARYDELSLADPVFGQLRNCMDLAVVAALIVRHDLPQKAQASLPTLMNNDGMETVQLPAPRQIASKAAVVNKGRKWVIAAGGVQINPWEIVEKSETSPAVAAVRTKAAIENAGQWWSN
jgi:hypothetical protein